MFLDDKIEINYNYFYQSSNNQPSNHNAINYSNKENTNVLLSNVNKYNINTISSNVSKHPKVSKPKKYYRYVFSKHKQ